MSCKPLALLAVFALSTGTATAASSWDLAANYLPNANPNGVWSYGELSAASGSFSALSWNELTHSYGVAAAGYAFVYQNRAAETAYGIDVGQVSLESDWGNAAVRWTAPVAGSYTFTIDVGGSKDYGGGGYGNNFAKYAGVKVDGVVLAADSFVDNVMHWSFTVSLAAGDTVDTYVKNPGWAGAGNTQTKILVASSVPEPTQALLLPLGLAVLGCLQRRRQAGRASTA